MAVQEAFKKLKEWASMKPRIKRLATQDQFSAMEIRFNNCIFVYKLDHIETQAYKYRRRKVGKHLGYTFQSLRSSLRESGKQREDIFDRCMLNRSDQSILQEHILNFETVKLKFTKCRFLRRENKRMENVRRFWRNYHGKLVNFSLLPGHFNVENEVIRLKDLPSTIEYIIEETGNEDLPFPVIAMQLMVA